MPVFANKRVSDNPSDWLVSTKHIDCDHPLVSRTAATLTTQLNSDKDKALAIFDYVSREIEFGFAAGFWDVSASDVIRIGRGYCNTKSTSFVALLRAAGIPARQVFVDIHASVLNGILNPGTPYVDHSYVEVFLDGDWRATDAYIVDPRMFKNAQKRLIQTDQLMGFGVHKSGSTEWNGRDTSFSQYDILNPTGISTLHHGPYKDVADFYKNANKTWNRLNPIFRAAFGVMSSDANRNANALRRVG